MMLKVLLFSTLLAVVLAHESSSESNEHFYEKHAHCPNVTGNSTDNACTMHCTNGTNCTTTNCSSDANCTGIQKCCQTNCGMKCVDPDYQIMCDDNDDCPGSLTCCMKSCVAVCVASKPAIPEGKKKKEPEKRKGRNAYMDE
ncbi:WAP four-disulfide core domain protein 2-like [Rana temporaria]|uniref:WAP four-disulfide core domain protein 2-like n=1 Tax=Rana temporaria TaxID=8407 RepID=UPI001AAD2845|nr:WAP four-disulfide core domain protein 2-like [Rana temporaria]